MSEARTVGEIVDRLPAPRAAVTPMQMLELAIQRGADVAMLEKLLGLQERWEANEARKAFVSAKAAFVAERPTIIKNKHVGFDSRKTDSRTEYDHATLDQACDVIGPALSKHGLSHSWRTSQTDGKIRVTCVLTHELGHSEEVWLEAGADTSGNKNAIQAIGSTVTYLQRYTLLAITGLATKGQDDDGQGIVEYISPEQKDELLSLIKETATSTAKFIALFGVAAIDNIPAAKFNEAREILIERRKAKEAKV